MAWPADADACVELLEALLAGFVEPVLNLDDLLTYF